jgi:acetylornithine/N-succinyldiaminopimelate aminotransferase
MARGGVRTQDCSIFYGGHAVAALGYGHPALTEAIASQASDAALPEQRRAARDSRRGRAKTCDFAPRGLERVFFVNSGAEANENALRIALKLTGRRRSSRSSTASTAARPRLWRGDLGRRKKLVRLPAHADGRRVRAARRRGGAARPSIDHTPAVIVEPVQGLAGAFDLGGRVPARSPHRLRSRRRAADPRRGADRHGAARSAFRRDAVRNRSGSPDDGERARGRISVRRVLMTPRDREGPAPGELGTTFGGGPLACAAIKRRLDAIIGKSCSRVRDDPR